MRHNKVYLVITVLLFIGTFNLGNTQDINKTNAHTLHVSVNGDDANPGTAAAPLRNIQTALNLASDDDTIKVAAGTYSEGFIPLTRVKMLGGYDDTFAEFNRDRFTNKTIIQAVSTAMLTDNTGCTIDGFIFDGNGVAETGLDINATSTITHNIILRVKQSVGYGIDLSGEALVANNTIHENIRGISIFGGQSASAMVKNNIITNNSFGIDNSAADGVHRYNDVYNNVFNYVGFYDTPGIGDISLDPQYLDPTSDDFRVQPTSPTIDRGDPLDPVGDEPQPNGGRIDLGAYGGTKNASTTNQPPEGTIDSPAGDLSILVGESVNFQGSGSDPDGHLPLTFLWDFEGGAPNSTLEDPGDVTFNTPGVFNVTFIVTDSFGMSDPTPPTVQITVSEPLQPTVELISPNGGEIWNEDVTHNIEWHTSNIDSVTRIQLWYSVDNGLSYSTIYDSLTNTGRRWWKIPRTPSNQALVKVIVYDTSGIVAVDSSDGPFTIQQVERYVHQTGGLSHTIRNDGQSGSYSSTFDPNGPSLEFPPGSERNHLYLNQLLIATLNPDLDTVATSTYSDDFLPVSSITAVSPDGYVETHTRYEDKLGLGIEVEERTLAFNNQSFVIFAYTVHNKSSATYSPFYVASFGDFDINVFDQNLTGYDPGNRLAYTYDATAGWTSYAGIRLLNNDPTAFHRWTITEMDPTTAGEVFRVLATPGFDDPSNDSPNDYRILESFGPLELLPGDSTTAIFALVVGEGLDGLQAASQQAQDSWQAPSVTTDAASNITTVSAILNATVNPHGLSTEIIFEYGETTSYGNTIVATQSPATGTEPIAVSAQLTGLSSRTTYHYRVVASNIAGQTMGADQVFTTLSQAEQFTRVTTGAIVNDGGFSLGGSWGDFDADGNLDLFVPNGNDQDNFLYRNNGDGTFIKITSGTVISDGGNSVNGNWIDYDGDGDLDLFVTNHGNNFLYRNLLDETGTPDLEKITTGIVVTDGGSSEGSVWGDFNNDGALDLFVANGNGENNFLYINNWDGTFTKITEGEIVNDGGDSRSCNAVDYDNDGDPDIFVTNSNGENNFLYRNEGDGLFTKITLEIIVNDGGSSVGSSWGDYDNDGDQDLFVANWNDENNFLYRNNGDGSFTRIDTGIVVTDGGFSQGSCWGDFDNDGDLDLFVANLGTVNFLYRNDGNGKFSKITTGDIVLDAGDSFGSSWADYDNDGDLDLFVANGSDQNNFLYDNNGNSNHWMNIKGVGTLSNSTAIGAKIRLKATIYGLPTWQIQEISSQSGFAAQNSLNAEFGLGDADIIDTLTIVWPSGLVWDTTGLSVDQFLRIREPSPWLSLISPRGGEKWSMGTVQNISWESNEVDSINIDFTTDYGTTWEFIASVPAADSSYPWTIPNTPSDQCLVRIIAVEYPIIDSYSDTTFSIVDNEGPQFANPQYSAPVNAGTDISVQFDVVDPSSVSQVLLLYRKSGTANFTSATMQLQSGDTYVGTIPGSSVQEPGVEFKVTAKDLYDNFNETGLFYTGILLPNGLINSTPQPSGNEVTFYRILSLPLKLDDPSPGAFLTANPDLGSYDKAKYRWFGVVNGQLTEYPNFGNLSPGKGFFFITNLSDIRLKSGSGRTINSTVNYLISLPQGWSLIGNPFDFNIPMDSLAVTAGSFEIWSYEGSWALNTRGLESWKGYAINLSQAAIFMIKPGVSRLNQTTSFYNVENNDATNWLIQITAQNGQSQDQFNFVGQIAGADNMPDELDLHEPPRLPQQVSVVFKPSPTTDFPLTADIRQPSSRGHIWEFTCLLNPEEELLSLEFNGVESLPPAFDAFLIDNSGLTAYNLTENQRLQFLTRGMTEKKFKLIVGTREYLSSLQLETQLYPSQYRLSQNFPNPFNPVTQIIYSVPEAVHVELKVYNAIGQLVTTLADEVKQPGTYKVLWNAENMGSGIYFYQMRAGSFVAVKKGLFIK